MTEYIIIIGTDNTESESPLAKALAEIGAALKKEMRVFVATQKGTYEYDRKQELSTTVYCARQVLLFENRRDFRLLLFDAASINEVCKPSSSLLPWLFCYRMLNEINPEHVPFDGIISEFLTGEDPGVWWSGLVLPSVYKVIDLAENGWNEVMRDLSHVSRKKKPEE